MACIDHFTLTLSTFSESYCRYIIYLAPAVQTQLDLNQPKGSEQSNYCCYN